MLNSRSLVQGPSGLSENPYSKKDSVPVLKPLSSSAAMGVGSVLMRSLRWHLLPSLNRAFGRECCCLMAKVDTNWNL